MQNIVWTFQLIFEMKLYKIYEELFKLDWLLLQIFIRKNSFYKQDTNCTRTHKLFPREVRTWLVE